ncbi:MAG: carbon-nitrogen hydrolase family protein [Cyclobacteriaceae bacterium]
MKIGLAQTRPVKGDISANLKKHQLCIKQGIQHGLDAIFFSELSITGYEPALAKGLVIAPGDRRFEEIQNLADKHEMIVGYGAPISNGKEVGIAMIIHQARKKSSAYMKEYLHEDEFPFFIGGKNEVQTVGSDPKIGLAICYELTVAKHRQTSLESGADIYLASVAKTESGAERSGGILSNMAKENNIITMMVNAVGSCDNFVCGGMSAAWDQEGRLIGQLGEDQEELLVIDTETLQASIIQP